MGIKGFMEVAWKFENIAIETVYIHSVKTNEQTKNLDCCSMYKRISPGFISRMPKWKLLLNKGSLQLS